MGLRKRRAGKGKVGVVRKVEARTEKGGAQVKVTPKMRGRRVERQPPPHHGLTSVSPKENSTQKGKEILARKEKLCGHRHSVEMPF